jgi:hypothetical protein
MKNGVLVEVVAEGDGVCLLLAVSGRAERPLSTGSLKQRGRSPGGKLRPGARLHDG